MFETFKLKLYLHCIYIIHVHTTSTSTFTFPFIALGNLSHLVLQNHSCMWCLVTSNKIFSLSSQKGDSIAGVNYLKVKNDVVHCKTIICDRSQIHAAPNFLLLSSRISSYVTITCCTLLHQATRGEGNNSFRKCRNIFVSDRDLNDFFVLHYDVLSSFMLYNIQFEKVKIFWGLGAGGRELDNPKTPMFVSLKSFSISWDNSYITCL